MKIRELDLGLGLVLAPMAGVTGLPFRVLARRHGADLVFSEMISSAALIRNPKRMIPYLMTCEEERPLGVQIFGSDAGEMAEAAAMLSDKRIDLIDINMGCPVRKVIRSGAGAALLRDIRQAEVLTRAVVRATPLPVTVKMRSGWDSEMLCAVDLAHAAEEAGAAALTLHPRTKTQAFGGHAEWDMIRKVKDAVQIPVIGNGDVRTAWDAGEMLARTGCDGVMIGRAALGRPWIFGNIRSYLLSGKQGMGPDPETIRRTLLLHLKMEVECSGKKRGVPRMRKFAAWYSRGLPGSSEFRDRINRQTGVGDFTRVVDDYFGSLQDTLQSRKAVG